MIAKINPVLRGWFTYFRHCYWPVFQTFDGRIRARMRAILVKRHRRNPKRLPRTQRWPNSYFANLGLYSLREAHFRFAKECTY